MSSSEQTECLREELASATALLNERNDELAQLRRDLERARSEANLARQQVQEVEDRHQRQRLELELDKLREIEALRKQFDIERKAIREDCDQEVAMLRERNRSLASIADSLKMGLGEPGELTRDSELPDSVSDPSVPPEVATTEEGSSPATLGQCFKCGDSKPRIYWRSCERQSTNC